MSESPRETDRRELERPTDVGLAHAFDDETDPRFVTLFPADAAEITTTWISMDVEHAVDPRELA